MVQGSEWQPNDKAGEARLVIRRAEADLAPMPQSGSHCEGLAEREGLLGFDSR